MAVVETILSEVIPQQLMPGTMRTDQKADPFFAQITSSSRGVTRLGVASDGWRWERVVSLGLGGHVQHVATAGPSILSPAQPMIVYTGQQLYPDPTLASTPGYDRMIGTLSQLRGNIILDEAYLRESMATGIVVDIFKDLMNSTALRLTLSKLASFYTPASRTRHICSTSSTNVTNVNGNAGDSVNFIPSEGNEVLFHEGHMIEFWETAGAGTVGDPILVAYRHSATGVSTTRQKIMVTAVDPITRIVYAEVLDGTNQCAITSTADNTVADGDLVTHYGQLDGGSYDSDTPANAANGTPVPQGAYGLVDWLVNSGSILGVDTSQFQRLKSLIKSNLAAPWTEEEADKHLMWYSRWHAKPITALFMTPGALLAHKKTALGMFTADRTGKPVTIVGGHTGISHVHDGKTVNYWQTPYMRSGFVVGVYMENNFEELHPPREPSSGGSGGFGAEVEFKVRGDGAHKSIFRIVSYTDGSAGVVVATTYREAPFAIWYNRWPMAHLPGILVGGVTESNWTA